MAEAYIDWSSEREGVINDTLDTLRDQRDEAQDAQFQGSFEIHPQAFKTGKHLVQGPFLFETAFQGAPHISFGEQQEFNSNYYVPVSEVTTNYTPFLVHTYVYALRVSNGVVDGFYVGLYALTEPPPSAQRHTITWKASGKASAYLDIGTQESWTEEYSYNEPEYVTEDAGYEYDDTEVYDEGYEEYDTGDDGATDDTYYDDTTADWSEEDL